MLNQTLSDKTPFPLLTPDIIISLAETELDCRCQAICNQLNSYINRVYALQTVDGQGVIIKFYRPDRWTRQAVEEADSYVLELQTAEIPVVAPFRLASGSTLAVHEGCLFSIFPQFGGRFLDEFSDQQWLEIGRLLGRMHLIGAAHSAHHRNLLHPLHTTAKQVKFLTQGDFMPAHMQKNFHDLGKELIELIAPLFNNMETIRLHGDCHFANLIHRPDESFYLIDFDDMVNGPPIQDIWMLLPSYRRDSLAEIELFLEGYQTFRDFNRQSLTLIEPLRAMRYIHYAAWCAQQSLDPGFTTSNPDWGTELYWQEESNDLVEQITRIRQEPSTPGNNPMFL